MSKRKRESTLFGEDEPADLHVLVAGRDEPLMAHRCLLKYFSEVVRSLPPSSSGPTVWDLRQVVLEDEAGPVDASVVQSWLDTVYSRVDASRSGDMSSDLADWAPLLKFADYVRTCSGVLHDIGNRLASDPDLFLEVAVTEQRRVRLLLHDSVYAWTGCALEEYRKEHLPIILQEQHSLAANPWTKLLVPASEFLGQLESFRSAASSAVETALYLAARLGLLPLIRTLRDFARAKLLPGSGSMILTPGDMHSPRVLRAMPREVLYEGYLESSFSDTSSHADLHGDVKAVFKSDHAALWFGKRKGQTVEGLALETDDEWGSFLHDAGHRLELQCTVQLGGMKPEDRAALVREALEKVSDRNAT